MKNKRKVIELIVDFHTHVYDLPDYASVLAETAQNLGFNKLCIGGGEPRYGLAANEIVIDAADAYPDLFIPFAFIRPGTQGPHDVENMYRDGFKGLKVGAPVAPYESEEFCAVLKAAETLNLPVLFHTRILPVTLLDRTVCTRADLARPVHLDAMARKMPDLKIIGTGLGYPWFEEASALLRVHKNIFFDLSGVRLQERGHHFFKLLLGGDGDNKWEAAPQNSLWRQIVFGTAVKNKDMPFIERGYQRLFRALVLHDNVVAGVMGKNALRLLGIN